LWPPQRDFLQRATTNPLDPDTKRLLLSVPTSAGKTLLAQILICHHLATQPGDVCYVTPLRSLGREMRQALAGRLRVLQKGLGGDQPDLARSASKTISILWVNQLRLRSR
jgi:replicative superfamily II helicase